MKLYINGDSHAAAAEAVNTYAFAEDDHKFLYLGRAPHPDNARVSWPRRLADVMKATLHNDSESASSNDRIMRTTRQWLQQHSRWLPETLVIIQWSTWEREEWWIDGRSYQVTASGTDDVPENHREQYKQFVSQINWQQTTKRAHQRVWDFHVELQNLGVRHVFMNGNNHFGDISGPEQRDWQGSYISPYDPAGTYDAWLKHNGFHTVSPKSWHFGRDAHAAWANFVLQYVIDNQLMT
jgi:hypothetical protein